MSLNEVGYDSLRKIFLTSLVAKHWATGGLRVNSSSVKGRLIGFPLFLLEENTIKLMTAMAGCTNDTTAFNHYT